MRFKHDNTFYKQIEGTTKLAFGVILDPADGAVYRQILLPVDGVLFDTDQLNSAAQALRDLADEIDELEARMRELMVSRGPDATTARRIEAALALPTPAEVVQELTAILESNGDVAHHLHVLNHPGVDEWRKANADFLEKWATARVARKFNH